MSEGRLDGRNKDELKSRVSWLLARHVHAQPCPLSIDEIADLYDRALGFNSPKYQGLYRAAKALADDRQELPLMTSRLGGIPLVTLTGQCVMFQYDGEDCAKEGYPTLHDPIVLPVPYKLSDWTLADSKLKAFNDWLMAAVITANRAINSMKTGETLINIANTAGQLNRMCPEFVRYIVPAKRKHAENQIRRSPLPPEWDDVSRHDVRRMVEHLALCNMAPDDVARSATIGNTLCSSVWAFDRHALQWSSYQVQTDTRAPRMLTRYHLGTDTWE